MRRALFAKEFRELAIWGLLCLAILSLALIDLTGVNPFTLQVEAQKRIPFINHDILTRLSIIGGVTAVLLGFRQTVGESVQGTWLLLLHRPMPRRTIVLLKLATGLTLVLSATFLPLLVYTLWAATPGTHASPFRWVFTIGALDVWFGLTTLYLGAFLCGLRDAHWFGSRLLPLLAVAFLFFLIYGLSEGRFWLGPSLMTPIIDVLLLIAILDVTGTREFAS